jgi:arabinogalactan oligomer/maltooligosaccharide transport system permease protein
MIIKGISCLAGLPGLGSREQEEIWNEKLYIIFLLLSVCP